jgi:hypothetical protein
MGLNQIVSSTKQLAHDNSTQILSAIGVAGTVTTAYLAGRASYFAAYMVNREEEELDRTQDPLTFKEKTQLVWTLYVPALVSGGATVTAIIMANRISSKRTAAYAAAYSVLETTFVEYQNKVVDEIGKRREQNVKDEIAQDRVKALPPSKEQIIVTSGGKVMCCELHTRRYFMSDMETLRRAQNDINAKIIHELYTSMSEFYDAIGLPHTTHSDNLGWNSDRLMELVFSTVLSEDGTPCIAFDYNYVKPI